MIRMQKIPILVVAVAVLLLGMHSRSVAATVGLLQALDEGTIWAEFYGTGELGVDAVIGRNPGGPSFVTIAPGTQFWAQVPRRQGMTTLGWVPVNLSAQSVARLRIPTACTNINLRAPTADDEMVPTPPPNAQLARLCGVVSPAEDGIHAMQVAVWAVANNPPRHAIERQAIHMLDSEATDDSARQALFDAILSDAAALLTRAGIDPKTYRMYR